MHSIFHLPAALRRHPVSVAPAAAASACLMQMTVATVSVTALRRLVMSVCGLSLIHI